MKHIAKLGKCFQCAATDASGWLLYGHVNNGSTDRTPSYSVGQKRSGTLQYANAAQNARVVLHADRAPMTHGFL